MWFIVESASLDLSHLTMPRSPPRNYLEEYKANIKFTDSVLSVCNQGILSRDPRSKWDWMVKLWPTLYVTTWVLIYVGLIIQQDAGLEIISQYIWCLMAIWQAQVKLITGLLLSDKIQVLLKWCEGNYTIKYKPSYQRIVDNVFEKTNTFIAMCIR